MQITPTHLNYYHICHRKLWLFAAGITMEHTSDTVYEGKLIGEAAYPQRPVRYTELDLGIAKIDFYDPHRRIVHEVKKSDKMEEAHIAQVKYYLYLLYQQGITDAKGLLEYPKLRKIQEVLLTSIDLVEIPEQLAAIEQLIAQTKCPARLKKSFCRRCSYFEFCYAEEVTEEDL
ncbi:CRISPR-associated protein Cas4 [Microscilla marina]|uniref:CRISPR-associated exonuclease Cas4 n=1 Tax=Microscilla marina ATCC 23134 TaxID=313606 RepID=A1ZVP7_MICM2|nr:CRISPR-associated protein Cas4 [Microscilla marina]EAY25590.1 crispr-associated protein Cas4 [Microscilla marina ATCC 23134]